MSSNTIRRWLREEEEAAQPTYARTEIPCKLTSFHATIIQALKADSHRTRQNRRTAKALFTQLQMDGYTGGYSQLTAFIRA